MSSSSPNLTDTRNITPTLPQLPTLEPIQFHDSPLHYRSPFLALPPDIRVLIYTTLLPTAHTIIITLETHSSLHPLLPLLRLCHFIHNEVSMYLSSKPITLYCPSGHRPSVLHRIPTSVLRGVEVVVIEDSTFEPLNLALLTRVKCICFGRTLVSRSLAPLALASPSDLNPVSLAEYTTSSAVERTMHPTKQDVHGSLLPLPTNNEVLKAAHAWWKDLRIDSKWILELWKERGDIRVVLRSVMELEVPGAGAGGGASGVDVGDGGGEREGVVFSYHSVVDVESTSVIEKRYLPDHGIGEDKVYDYGNARWWRRK